MNSSLGGTNSTRAGAVLDSVPALRASPPRARGYVRRRQTKGPSVRVELADVCIAGKRNFRVRRSNALPVAIIIRPLIRLVLF
eukprot:1188844-Prorocentrum_minimum.AAC.5